MNKIKFIEDYKKSKNAASGSVVDQNANVSEKNIATLSSELGKFDNIMLQREVMRKYITQLYGPELADQYEIDLTKHTIYRHDETSGAGGLPYCCAITLYPFLLDGMKTMGGSSAAPKHADSFVGGLINLLFAVAAQHAGACAAPETLTYLDYFLRKDYGDDYHVNLDAVVGIRKDGKITLKEKIEGLFGQFVYSINQPAAARGNQSIFFNIACFDENYFKSIFDGFVFPDGDEPNWSTTSVLQKLFMKWFNKERLKSILTFPVETANMYVENGKYADEDVADFMAEMWSEGASFMMYQSDSVDALSSCCRLRNAIEREPFSYTLGAGGIKTGSKAVITMNLNRIVQDADRDNLPIAEVIAELTKRVHKYLNAFNEKLHDDFKAGLLTPYNAGYIGLDDLYLTVGINGFVEAAEYLGIEPDADNQEYREFAQTVLGTIETLNQQAKTPRTKYNLEFVPGENLGVKFADWDKRDGYKSNRDCHNSYFYPVENNVDVIQRFYAQGKGFADICSGGVALHNNLEEHLTKEQYRKLMDVAVQAGCNYFTYNIPNTICNKCDFISKHKLTECPDCGSKDLDYATRVIGYLKRVSSFSERRQKEEGDRFYAKV